MEKFKGTKGKWIFDKSLYIDTECEAIVEAYQGGWDIARVQDGSRNNNSSVIRANAQLIAAAPELLKFAMFVAKHEKGSAPSVGYFQEMIERAEQIINKALES